MAEAWWNDTLIARSDDIVTVEGNAYFPLEAVTPGVLQDSATTSGCPWKGTASYYTLTVNGAENRDAAWTYPAPKDAAKEIRGRVAFWRAWRCGDKPLVPAGGREGTSQDRQGRSEAHPRHAGKPHRQA